VGRKVGKKISPIEAVISRVCLFGRKTTEISHFTLEESPMFGEIAKGPLESDKKVKVLQAKEREINRKKCRMGRKNKRSKICGQGLKGKMRGHPEFKRTQGNKRSCLGTSFESPIQKGGAKDEINREHLK